MATAIMPEDKEFPAAQFARRVLMIAQNHAVPFDQRIWQQARELVKQGYIVSIVCTKGRGYDASHETIDDVNIFRHPQAYQAKTAIGAMIESAGMFLWGFMLANRIFFTVGFDVIHVCNPPDNSALIGAFFKLFFGKKLVFDHQRLTPETCEARYGRRSIRYNLALALEKFAFRVADVSLSGNESFRIIAIERGKMPTDKVFEVRSAPDPEQIKIVPAVDSLKKGRKYLAGYVGDMIKHQGVEILIEAVRVLVHDLKRKDTHFALVGDGPALADLKRLAALQGVADYITFTEYLAGEEMLKVLCTADICVNPVEVNPARDKVTSKKIMDFMALGKPIVQFEVTEDRISADGASLYATPNDASDFAKKIIILLDNPGMREEMGKTGRTRAESELTWKRIAPRLAAAYDALFVSKSD